MNELSAPAGTTATMETTETQNASLVGLFRSLTADTKGLIRQELQLAKTEISEKISTMGKNGVLLAIGGLIAYAGLILLLIGLGWLAGWGLQQAGLNPQVANFLGLLSVGFLIAVIGTILLLNAVKTLKAEPLAPRKTILTLKELKAGRHTNELVEEQQQLKKLSSDEIQARVERTEERMGETLDEIGYRLSPRRFKQQVKDKIETNPYRAGLIAAGAGLVGGWLFRRRSKHV